MFLRYFSRKKDSKSKIKTNSSPGLIRAYVRTETTTKFSRLHGFINFYAYGCSARRRLRRPRELRYKIFVSTNVYWLQWIVFVLEDIKIQYNIVYYSTNSHDAQYGQKVIVIRHLYITDILRYTKVAKIRLKLCKALNNHSFSRCKISFVDKYFLNNKTILSCLILQNIV